MLTRIVQITLGLAVVAGGLWVGFVVAFRTKFRPVQDAIRRMNRRVINPRQLQTAGKRGEWVSVVRHRGRKTGEAYRTPVGPVEVERGFLVPLPYGPRVDWARNVLAAGSASLEHEGDVIEVADPEIVHGRDANQYFPAGQQRTHRLMGVDDFLLLKRRPQAGGS